MFNLAPVFAKRGGKPAAKRTPPSARTLCGRKEALTTITADPLLADPMLAPAPLLTFDVTAPDGTYAGAFQGSTPDDAILSYVATLGYASIDDAAIAQGFADAATYLASFTVTETLAPAGMDPSLAPLDPLAAPAALSRRRRKSAEHLQSLVDIALPTYGVVDYTVEGLNQLLSYIDAQYAVLNSTDPLNYGIGRGEYLDSLKVAVQEELALISGAAPAALSRRFRRKAVDQGVLDFLASFTPEQIDAVVTANDWGMIGAEWDGTAWVGVYADGLNEPLSDETVYEIALQLGWVAPAETLGDGMYPEGEDEEETPAEVLSRRARAARFRRSQNPTVAKVWSEATGIIQSVVPGYEQDAGDAIYLLSTQLGSAIQAEFAAVEAEFQELQDWLITEANRLWDIAQSSGAPATLSARSRRSIARRLALKAAFTVADATTGDVLGTYDATTSDDAILSYVAEVGYGSVEEAAAGMGFSTVDEFLASISVAEGAEAEAAPAETPAETLSRRHRMMRKAMFDVSDPTTGEILGSFDAGTIDDAILSYAASLGFDSADAAAAAAGLTVEEWLATFTITEAAPAADAPPAEAEDVMDDEDEEEPAEVARRGRF